MFREQLLNALHSAVSFRNSGLGDATSVVKAAEQHDFNPQQTQRLVETYNTAKTIYHFKTADDRRSSFAIVEPAEVMSALFSEKAASAPVAVEEPWQLRDYSFYDLPEEDHLNKTAYIPPEVLKKSAEDMTVDSLVFRANKEIRGAIKSAEYCNSTAGICRVRYNQAVDKLASFVRSANYYGDKMADLEHGAWATFGRELAEPVMDDVAARFGPKQTQKRAEDGVEHAVSTFDTRNPETVTLIKEAIDARFGFAEMTASAGMFTKLAEEWQQQFNSSIPQLQSKEASGDSFDEFLEEGFCKAALKSQSQDLATTFSFDDLLGMSGESKPGPSMAGKAVESLGKGVGGAVGSQVAKGTEGLMFGPQERSEKKIVDRLKNLQRQQILEELLTTDPILRGEDPTKVVSIYQSLWQVAPEVSMNKEVVRSILRAGSQAVSVSPYDAKTWAELETEVKKHVVLDKQKPGTKKPGGES